MEVTKNLEDIAHMVKQRDLLGKYTNEDLYKMIKHEHPFENISHPRAEFTDYSCEQASIPIEVYYNSFHFLNSSGTVLHKNLLMDGDVFKKYFIKYLNKHRDEILLNMVGLMDEEIKWQSRLALMDLRSLESEIKEISGCE